MVTMATMDDDDVDDDGDNKQASKQGILQLLSWSLLLLSWSLLSWSLLLLQW